MEVKILKIREAKGSQYCSSKDIYELMKEESLADREIFWVLHLNTKNQIIEKEIAHIGCMDSANVSPKDTLRKAVVNCTASIICVHNHPSGDPKPSEPDKEITKQFVFACTLLDINLLDHIILGKDKYYSFTDAGYIENYKVIAKDKLNGF